MYLCLVMKQHKLYILGLILMAILICSPVIAQKGSRKIGLLLPTSKSTAEMMVAASVVEAANAQLDPEEAPFELVVRTVEGPWGAGSKESVSLVYEDSVLLYLGALDGGNAHLAEQVAAKAHLPYIETRATESTLSQAYVPWFVRVVPNDDQQSSFLVKAISDAGGGKTLILSRDNSDTRYAVRSLVKAGAKKDGISPVILEWLKEEQDSRTIFKKICQMKPDHLVFTFWSEDLFRLSRELWKQCPEIMLYGNLDFISGLQQYPGPVNIPEGLIAASPYGYLDYLADGLMLAMEAIRTHGTSRDILKDQIPQMKYSGSITGPILFDDMGNRLMPIPSN